MYEKFFGFRERPFDLTPNPRFLVPTESHLEALRNLEYGIASRKGVTLLIGEAGSGKTTVIRAAIDRRPSQVHCSHITNPTLSRAEFNEALADTFGLSVRARSSKASMLTELEELLTMRRESDETTVLVMDEAQSMPLDLLEEIRLLANIETNAEKLISIVMAGQPELADRLNEPGLRQLKQRVALRCEIRPLTLNETKAYLAGRIRAAGGARTDLFTEDAVRLMTDASRGLPRTINVIADNALLGAFAEGSSQVTVEIVRVICRDFTFVADLPLPHAAKSREQKDSMFETIRDDLVTPPPVADVVLPLPHAAKNREQKGSMFETIRDNVVTPPPVADVALPLPHAAKNREQKGATFETIRDEVVTPPPVADLALRLPQAAKNREQRGVVDIIRDTDRVTHPPAAVPVATKRPAGRATAALFVIAATIAFVGIMLALRPGIVEQELSGRGELAAPTPQTGTPVTTPPAVIDPVSRPTARGAPQAVPASAPRNRGRASTPPPVAPRVTRSAAMPERTPAARVTPAPPQQPSRPVVAPVSAVATPRPASTASAPAAPPPASPPPASIGTGAAPPPTLAPSTPVAAETREPAASASRPVDSAPLTPTPAASAAVATAPAAPAPAPPAPVPPETAAIQSVLERYRQAFETLSADGIESVWPAVNTRNLQRAFNQLSEQTIAFDSCTIRVTAAARAAASCGGRTSFVPKVGSRTTRSESRRWDFQLSRNGGYWIIDRVETR